MGEPNKFHELLGRALVDEDYRKKLRDPATRVDALKELGIAQPTQRQLDDLQRSIQAVEDLSGVFGGGIGAA